MERNSSTITFMSRKIVFVFDAMKCRNMEELKDIVSNILVQGDIIQGVNSMKLLGVLDKVPHPMGFQIQVGPDSFVGAHARAIEEEVSRKVGACAGILQKHYKYVESQGVDIEVKIVVGAPLKNIIVQEIVALDATWAILDRQLRKDLNFYLQHIPCKVAQVVNALSFQVLRPYYLDKRPKRFECKQLYSLSKPVSRPPSPEDVIDEHCDILSVISSAKSISRSGLTPVSKCNKEEEIVILQAKSSSNHQQELANSTGCFDKLETNECVDSCQVMQTATSEQGHSEVSTAGEMIVSEGCCNSGIPIKPVEHPLANAEKKNQCADSPPLVQLTDNSSQMYPDAHDHSSDDEIVMSLNSTRFTYSMIQTATDNFSQANMLGEGRHGIVYKGQLKDGHLIVVKVKKGANAQDSHEFHSQVFVYNTVLHRNIEKLLGYVCKENLNILVYEYTCNKSLEWHLFENALEWHHRQAIAIGIAKGLNFLHKEWWASPLIHQDIRPSNILLTDGFVPLLSNCSLPKSNLNSFDLQTRSPDNLVYLAPEYAENGIFSTKTDVYALGIVLIQLISGRKAEDSTRDKSQQSLREWALPLIQTLSLDELVDSRLGNSYYMYELYSMTRAACMCIQTNPDVRPTAEEVLHLLEGTNDHLRHLNSNLYPIILSTEASLN